MLRVPAVGVPGEVCWVAVRNLREDPSHAEGDGKPRPGVLVRELEDRWLVIGTTSVPRYRDGARRTRIPDHLWSQAYPALHGPGYLWGTKVQYVPHADLGDHIGWAPPELRALAVGPIVNLRQCDRNDFLRYRPDEV